MRRDPDEPGETNVLRMSHESTSLEVLSVHKLSRTRNISQNRRTAEHGGDVTIFDPLTGEILYEPSERMARRPASIARSQRKAA